ncbi:SMP-30/gluconolactonase/LRE family protein [Agarivorans sp. QJM3NY_25]|uniref:SMP-30/gluconolactonase/LRE family protein n=1 Tax=Agarivorans sp. QJM3NY_25 TaxID=3421430 RepID=UPI003D7D3475
MSVHVLDCPANQLGESPLWDASRNRLIWADIKAKKVCFYDFTIQQYSEVFLFEEVGCLTLHQSGAILLALENQLGYLSPNNHNYVKLQELEADQTNNRFNESCCDNLGRWWFGSQSLDGRASIYRMDLDGSVSQQVSSLYTVNGMAFAPDGKTLMYSDSFPTEQQIWQCAYDQQTGQILDHRKFLNTTDLDFRPDGAMFDSQAGYWLAGIDSGKLLRFDLEQRRIVDSYQLPSKLVSKCCFIGPQLSTIAVTSIQDKQRQSSGHVYYFDSKYTGRAATLCQVKLPI